MDTISQEPSAKETLTPVSRRRAQELLEEGRAAEAAGDNAKAVLVQEKIMEDPSLGHVVKEEMEKQSSPDKSREDGREGHEEDEHDLKEARLRLSKTAAEIVSLYTQLLQSATAAGEIAVTYDVVGTYGDDMKRITSQANNLLNSGQPEDLENAIKVLDVDGYIDKLTKNIKHLVGYFGGDMPEALIPQVRILDKIKEVNESLKTTNADWQKLKK